MHCAAHKLLPSAVEECRHADQATTHDLDVRHSRLTCRGLVLDATAKGALARFINHSCGANCETQKWIVRGETRVGIFARQTIRPGQEITYNYHLEWAHFKQIPCALQATQLIHQSKGRPVCRGISDSARNVAHQIAPVGALLHSTLISLSGILDVGLVHMQVRMWRTKLQWPAWQRGQGRTRRGSARGRKRRG